MQRIEQVAPHKNGGEAHDDIRILSGAYGDCGGVQEMTVALPVVRGVCMISAAVCLAAAVVVLSERAIAVMNIVFFFSVPGGVEDAVDIGAKATVGQVEGIRGRC